MLTHKRLRLLLIAAGCLILLNMHFVHLRMHSNEEENEKSADVQQVDSYHRKELEDREAYDGTDLD